MSTSVDFYRNQDDAYWAPAVAYPAHIYPKMHAHQFAMTVPQAFGRKNLSKNWIERWREDKKWDEWSVEVREKWRYSYTLYFPWSYVCTSLEQTDHTTMVCRYSPPGGDQLLELGTERPTHYRNQPMVLG
jgi:hypothetical protein